MSVVCFPLSLYLDFNLISSVEPKLTDKGFSPCVRACGCTGINFNIIITKSICGPPRRRPSPFPPPPGRTWKTINRDIVFSSANNN